MAREERLVGPISKGAAATAINCGRNDLKKHDNIIAREVIGVNDCDIMSLWMRGD